MDLNGSVNCFLGLFEKLVRWGLPVDSVMSAFIRLATEGMCINTDIQRVSDVVASVCLFEIIYRAEEDCVSANVCLI